MRTRFWPGKVSKITFFEKEHSDDSTDCRLILTYIVKDRYKRYSLFFAKFVMYKALSFINTNERFMSCQEAIWQEDDLEILYYLNETKQHFPLTKMIYPAQNFKFIPLEKTDFSLKHD